MCKFLSAIVMKDGKIIADPEHTDSHSDLIAAHGLRDESLALRGWIRVEFTSNKLDQPDTYKLTFDDSRPGWFDKAMEFDVTERLRQMVAKMIVRDTNLPILLGGCWIVTGKSEVQNAKNTTIKALYDSAKIGFVSDSAKIDFVSDSAKIDFVYDSAKIGFVSDSAKIDFVSDSAKIGFVSGSATIGSVYDSAKIDFVSDSAKIDFVYGSAKIDFVYGSATIGSVYGSATIGSVYDSAKIDFVSDSAKIENDKRTPPPAETKPKRKRTAKKPVAKKKPAKHK